MYPENIRKKYKKISILDYFRHIIAPRHNLVCIVIVNSLFLFPFLVEVSSHNSCKVITAKNYGHPHELVVRHGVLICTMKTDLFTFLYIFHKSDLVDVSRTAEDAYCTHSVHLVYASSIVRK